MPSEPSPANTGRHSPTDVAWSISPTTRQGVQEADACMVPEDWQYRPPNPLVAPEPATPPTPAR